MCIVFWTLEHPDYALILCSNRDEYLTRPTQDAHFHNVDHSVNRTHEQEAQGNILSGIDSQAGGSWLGINKQGRVAVLTNIIEPYGSYATSRGILVSSFLLSKPTSRTLEDEFKALIPLDTEFAGFNLILLAPSYSNTHSSLPPDSRTDSQRLSLDGLLVTNNGSGGSIRTRNLSADERKCGSFSNGIDAQGDEDWPKVRLGKAAFADIVTTHLNDDDDGTELAEKLLAMMTVQAPRPIEKRSDLRETIEVAPFLIPDLQLEEKDRVYGTRLSTVILIKRDGRVLFIERDIYQSIDGEVKRATKDSQRRFEFQLDALA